MSNLEYQVPTQEDFTNLILEANHTIANGSYLRTTEEEARQLEEQLNYVFSKEANKSSIIRERKQKVFNIIKQYYENIYGQQFDKTITTLEDLLSRGKIGLESNNSVLIPKEYSPSKHHAKYVEVNTLRQARIDVQKVLENIEKEKNIKQLTKEIKVLETKANILLSFLSRVSKQIYEDSKGKINIMENSSVKDRSRLQIDSHTNFRTRMDWIDTIYCQCVAVAALANNDMGQIWETILHLFSIEGSELISDVASGAVQSMKQETLQGFIKTAGSDTVNKSSIGQQKNSLLSLGFSSDTKFSQKVINDKVYKTIKINGVEIVFNEVYNSHSNSRQGKIDVRATFPFVGGDLENPPEFKISAKNWYGENNKDFGETQLAYAIDRTYSLEALHRYIHAFFPGRHVGKEKTISSAHQAAKFAVLLDTVMGYSEKEKSADVLVINVRKGDSHKIKVYSIQKIMRAAANQDFKVNGYKPETIKKDLSKITSTQTGTKLKKTNSVEFAKNRVSFEHRLNRGQLYLQSLMVSVHFSAIKKLYGDKK